MRTIAWPMKLDPMGHAVRDLSPEEQALLQESHIQALVPEWLNFKLATLKKFLNLAEPPDGTQLKVQTTEEAERLFALWGRSFSKKELGLEVPFHELHRALGLRLAYEDVCYEPTFYVLNWLKQQIRKLEDETTAKQVATDSATKATQTDSETPGKTTVIQVEDKKSEVATPTDETEGSKAVVENVSTKVDPPQDVVKEDEDPNLYLLKVYDEPPLAIQPQPRKASFLWRANSFLWSLFLFLLIVGLMLSSSILIWNYRSDIRDFLALKTETQVTASTGGKKADVVVEPEKKDDPKVAWLMDEFMRTMRDAREVEKTVYRMWLEGRECPMTEYQSTKLVEKVETLVFNKLLDKKASPADIKKLAESAQLFSEFLGSELDVATGKKGFSILPLHQTKYLSALIVLHGL